MTSPAIRREPTHKAPRLSRTHAEALLVLAGSEPGTGNDDLAALIGCAPSTVKTLLRVLEERGLIRIVGVRQDRRFFVKPPALDLAHSMVDSDLHSVSIPSPSRDKAEDPRYQERERRCLTCGKDFLSSWAGNRICGRCKNLSTAGIL